MSMSIKSSKDTRSAFAQASIAKTSMRKCCAQKQCLNALAQLATLEEKDVIDRIAQSNIVAFGNACPANNAEVRNKINTANVL